MPFLADSLADVFRKSNSAAILTTTPNNYVATPSIADTYLGPDCIAMEQYLENPCFAATSLLRINDRGCFSISKCRGVSRLRYTKVQVL